MSLHDSKAEATVENNDTEFKRGEVETQPDLAPATLKMLQRAKSIAVDFNGKYILLTPEIAKQLLMTMVDNNRPLSNANVEKLKARIIEGWQVQDEGIQVDVDGRLIDGQHRCWAVLETGIAILIRVAYGVATEAVKTMNGGKTRSMADQYRVTTGNVSAKKTTEIASVVRAIVAEGNHSFRFQTVEEIQTVVDTHIKGIEWALEQGTKRQNALLPSAVRGALAVTFCVHPTLTREFTTQYLKGNDLSDGSPILALRNLVIAKRRKGTETERRDLALKAIRAVYAHCKGEEIRQLVASEKSMDYFKTALQDS